MILNIGVRTTEPVTVAYRSLGPDEDEASATAQFLGELRAKGIQFHDTTLTVYYDAGVTEARRELLVPVAARSRGVETRVFPPKRVAFLVFTGPESRKEEYYKLLRHRIEEHDMEPERGIRSIEASYVPKDLDEEEWKTELMIPLA